MRRYCCNIFSRRFTIIRSTFYYYTVVCLTPDDFKRQRGMFCSERVKYETDLARGRGRKRRGREMEWQALRIYFRYILRLPNRCLFLAIEAMLCSPAPPFGVVFEDHGKLLGTKLLLL